MTMLITKFNKLIANKFIWIGFVVLIVLAFVVWDISIPEDARDPSARMAAGTLFGEPVSPEEFQRARIHTYMALVLSIGRPIPITPDVDRELNNMAWRRLVSLRKGDELGLQTSNREVIEAIRNYPGFQQQGQFDGNTYRNFLQQYLGSMGFSGAQFEEHVRQELVVQKLQRMVTESILISPAEVDRAIQTIGDEFTVQYALIDEAVLGEGLTVSEEEAKAYFAEHLTDFTIPPKVRVKYVRFPIADYVDVVEVSEDQAQNYYDINIENYVSFPEQGEEEDDLFQVSETIPFEDVREEILDQLRREEAARHAADAAMDFVIKLVPDRQGIAATFEDAAAGFERTVERAAPFARGETPEGIDAGMAFSMAAFELRLHPEFYFSDSIQGTDNIYVIALEERIPEREPVFEEVADQVYGAAERAAVTKAMEDLAQQFKEVAEAEMKAGSTFSEAAEPFAIPVQNAPAFTAGSGLEDLPFGSDIVRTVLTYNQGEVTDPVSVSGGYLVMHVAQRIAADPTQYADFRPEIIASLTRERGRILFEEWQEQLLREADFKPRTVDPVQYDDEEFEDDWASQ